MNFDFTKEVSLDDKNYLLYRRFQISLYSLAVLSGAYFAYLVLFPTAYFTFSFLNPNSLQNTIINPRLDYGKFADNGKISRNLSFDAALAGNYSKIKISFELSKKSDPLESGQISLKKSYQAFLYPEEDYSNISSSDSAIFKVDNKYYSLKDNKLAKFISEKAYLTRYAPDQAIEKDADFLKNYELSDEIIGFADGTLISYGISAYIVSSGHILPINNVTTFSAMGYDWNDVIPVSGDEVSLYEKDKLFTLSSPHPTGTIMKTKENGKYYLIRDYKKYELPNEIADRYILKKSPVSVSEKSLDLVKNCQIKKETLSFRTYSCEISLEDFKDLIGKDYELKLTTDNEIRIDVLNISFEKSASYANLKLAVKDIINKIKGNYVQVPPQ